jgi:hypothetical protein
MQSNLSQNEKPIEGKGRNEIERLDGMEDADLLPDSKYYWAFLEAFVLAFIIK